MHIDNSEKTNMVKTDSIKTQVSYSSYEQREHIIRVLLDSGSQSSFIHEDIVSLLKFAKVNAKVTVTGFNNQVSCIQYQGLSLINIHSCDDKFKTNLACLINHF